MKKATQRSDDESLAIVQWRIEEAARAGGEILNMMRADERILAVGVSIIAAISTVVIDSKQSDLLVYLPFSLAALVTFSNYQRANMMGLGGYKKALEESITEHLGTPVILWESTVAPKMHNNIPTLALRGILLTIYVASAAGAWEVGLRLNAQSIWPLVVNVVGLFGALFSWLFSLSRFQSVYQLTASALNEGRSTDREFARRSELAAPEQKFNQFPPPKETQKRPS